MPLYTATAQANGFATVPLTGTIITSTASASATSTISQENAFELAFIEAKKRASLNAQIEANKADVNVKGSGPYLWIDNES